MNLKNYFNEELLVCNLEVQNREEVFEKVSDLLYNKGYVKETFVEGLKDREKVFPTGLKLSKYNVAIPHTEACHVIKPVVTLVTLKKPIIFKRMEDDTKEIEVRLIFVMALCEPHSQVMMLQELMSLIQNEEMLEKIIKCKNHKELSDVIKENL